MKAGKQFDRKQGDSAVARVFVRSMLIGFVAVGIVCCATLVANAQGPADGMNGPPNGQWNGQPNGGAPNGGQWNGQPVYQRHPYDRKRRDWRRDDFRRQMPFMMPQTNSAWFQRPYPYHLDYYKMRWGGSYAPYFGNLYGTPFGTPQVVNGGGGWGPGAGGWGGEGGGAYPPAGMDGVNGYGNTYPPGATMSGPPPISNSTSQSTEQQQTSQQQAGQQQTPPQQNESLPPPVK